MEFLKAESEVNMTSKLRLVMILLCGGGCTFLTNGFAVSFGLLQVEWVEYFKTQRAVASWIGSLSVALLFVGGPFAGLLSDKITHRLTIIIGTILAALGQFGSSLVSDDIRILYATYGILNGLGLSLIFLPAIVCAGLNFEKRRSIAIGFVVAGGGIGQMVYPLLHEHLIKLYTWRGCLRIEAVMTLSGILFAIFMKPPLVELDPIEHTKEMKETFKPSVLKNVKLYLMICSEYLWNAGSFMLYSLIADHLILNGFKTEAAMVLSMMGAANIVGRLLGGCFGNIPKINRTIFYTVLILVSGITIAVMPAYNNLIYIIICSLLYAVCLAMQLANQPVVAADMFGEENMSSAFGFFLFADGLGAVSGPPIAGVFYDNLNSYDQACYTCGGIIILASVFVIVAYGISIREQRRKNEKLFEMRSLSVTNLSNVYRVDQNIPIEDSRRISLPGIAFATYTRSRRHTICY